MDWKICNINEISADDYAAVYRDLTPSRRSHIDRLQAADARARSLAGEYLAKQLLRDDFGIASPVIYRAAGGRPYVEGDAVYISIAHCGDYAVCAADTKPIGIDIERIRTVRPQMLERVCTEAEREYIMQSGEPDFVRFCEIWTAKEAYFKMLGTGITDFKSVDTLTLGGMAERMGEYIIRIVR